MSYDISMFWPWLLAALILGAIVGWLSDRWRSGGPMLHGWRKWALIAWVVGLILAMLHWLPGRTGLWLETALLFSFCYAVACLIGGWLRAVVEGDKPMASTAAKTAMAPSAAPVAPASKPAASVPPAVDPDAGTPLLLAAARGGEGDDLTRIKDIDGWTQGRLKALGVWHYGQIADWSPANAAWVDGHLRLNGRVGLEKWVDQAKGLLNAPTPVPAAGSAPVDKPAAPVAASEPLPAPTQNYTVSANAGVDGKPLTLTGAIGGQGDDLTRIQAIGARDAGNLNALGIWHYAQIARWSPANQTWVDGHFAAPGRVESEQWAPQAKRLVESGATTVTTLPLPAPAHAAPEPALTGKVEGEDRHAGARPVGYVSPRGGRGDDLKRIRGIGPQNEGRLHALGIWHFAQIAAWSHDNVSWVGSYLAFPGRIDREEWIAQAKTLAAGGETQFSKRVDHAGFATGKAAVAEGGRNIADLSKIKRHE